MAPEDWQANVVHTAPKAHDILLVVFSIALVA